jgi:hypothetical protein
MPKLAQLKLPNLNVFFLAKIHKPSFFDLGNRPFILDFYFHPMGEHTEEGTAEPTGEGSKAEGALHKP